MQLLKGVSLLSLATVVLLSLFHSAHGAGYATFSYTPVPVRPDLFGINFNWWINPTQYALNVWPENPTGANLSLPYDNPVLFNFLKNIQATSTRYPAGTSSSFWNVSSNNYILTSSPLCPLMVSSGSSTRCTTYTGTNNTIVNSYPTDYFSIGHFGTSMSTAGFKWTYVANLVSTTPDEIIAAIESVCANGNTSCPTYLELGNEYYLKYFYPSTIYPNSSVYAAQCQQVYSAVGHYFNGNVAAIGDFGGYVSNNQSNPDVMWNAGLLNKKGVAYDSLTVHTYSLSSTNFGNTKNPDWSWYTLMLAWPETNIRVSAEKHRTQFPGVNLWLTEFNYAAAQSDTGHSDAPGIFATHQKWQPSHGINIASFYLTMLAYPDIFTKADLFESLRDNYLSSYMVNASGYFAYAPGQIFSHLSYIMKSHDNYTYLTMNDVDLIPPLSWYNNYAGNMSALQGAAFLSDTKVTYVIINRVNYSIDVNLTTVPSLTQLVTYTYNGTQSIGNYTAPASGFETQFDPTSTPPYNVSYLTTTNSTITGSDEYTATLLPFTMQVIEFTGGSAATLTATISTSTSAATTGAATTASTTDATTGPTTVPTTGDTTTGSSTSAGPTSAGPTSAGPTSAGPTTASPTPAPTAAVPTAAPTSPPAVLTIQIIANITGDPSLFNVTNFAQLVAAALHIDPSRVNVTIIIIGSAKRAAAMLYEVITVITITNPDATQIASITNSTATSVGSTLATNLPAGSTLVAVSTPQSTYTAPTTAPTTSTSTSSTPTPTSKPSSASSLSLSFATLVLVVVVAIFGN